MTATAVGVPQLPVPTAAVTATPTAAALVRRVGQAPAAPLHAVVVGPGGTGKTALLDAVARAYAAAGVEVVRCDPHGALPQDPPRAAALLVDDAHRLDDPAIERLRYLAHDQESRVVVAHRPWPRPALTTGAGWGTSHRTVVVLGHLPRDAVAARIAERVGVTPPAAMVDLVHEQSGGLPVFVEIVTQALRDTGRFDARHPDAFRRPDVITVSVALAERLRHLVDAVDPDVRALLEAMALGAGLDGEVLGPLLDVPAEALTATVEAARATGLLTESGALIPFARGLFLRLTPVLRARELQRRLAGIELERGGSVLAAGRQLLGTGASGGRIAAVLRAAADEALPTAPSLAADLLREAAQAGAPSREIAGRHARALALAGELDEALRVGDPLVADPAAPGREDAVLATAAVLAHRGLPARSAELYRSLSPATALLAVPGLVATGAVDEARAVLADADGHGGTLLDGAAALMGRGMVATVDGSAQAALSQLARAAVLLEPVAATTLLPDTPAALTAAVAVQCGELSVAQTALRRALAQGHGGRAARTRHRLLHSWVLMCRGRFGPARPGAAVSAEPEPRDELVAAALAVGLARRTDDHGALTTGWERAREALVRHPVDLTTLPQLGELTVAAAHLGEEVWLEAHLAEADDLLERLGRPPLWCAPLRWYRLQAALAAGRDAEVAAHASALDDDGGRHPYPAVLAAAARCWTLVLAGRPDTDELLAVGRRMHAVGLGWEGAQLVGRAATLTDDRRVTAGLHAAARTLYAGGAEPREAGTAVPDLDVATSASDGATAAVDAVAPAPAAGDADRAGFSERELEIGRHILAGLTYKQIGQRLYLSAKTVEHHVARMRQRTGAGSRDELFGLLRAALEPAASP